MRRFGVRGLLVWLGLGAAPAAGQQAPGEQGSRNVQVLAHVPLGGAQRVGDIELEQELARPFAYVSLRLAPAGFQILNLKDPGRAQMLYRWQIEQADQHRGAGAVSSRYLKSFGRYYLAQVFQFDPGTPDADLGAIIFDMTGLPDTSAIREVARLRAPEYPGGFRGAFAYKHSSGLALLFVATTGPFAFVYDIERMVHHDPRQGLVARIPIPVDSAWADAAAGYQRGYQEVFVGYDANTKQDKFYGAGAGGYHIYDVSDLAAPRLLTSVTGVAGVTWGQSITPTPDGRYAFTQTDYRFAPSRVFDLKPGLDGEQAVVSRPVGAWTADWRSVPRNAEVRWPYAFISHQDKGLQIVNLMDPTNPYTVAYYDTFDGPDGKVRLDGALGVDVRNADGLIVVSDLTTGFWALKLEGFDGWNGRQWGLPNMSSVQDWDNGPDGAPPPRKVT